MVDSSNLYIHNHKFWGCFYSYSEIKNIMHSCPSKTKGFEEHVGGATLLSQSGVANHRYLCSNFLLLVSTRSASILKAILTKDTSTCGLENGKSHCPLTATELCPLDNHIKEASKQEDSSSDVASRDHGMSVKLTNCTTVGSNNEFKDFILIPNGSQGAIA